MSTGLSGLIDVFTNPSGELNFFGLIVVIVFLYILWKLGQEVKVERI